MTISIPRGYRLAGVHAGIKQDPAIEDFAIASAGHELGGRVALYYGLSASMLDNFFFGVNEIKHGLRRFSQG